jgi:hypothetical protein
MHLRRFGDYWIDLHAVRAIRHVEGIDHVRAIHQTDGTEVWLAGVSQPIFLAEFDATWFADLVASVQKDA